MPDLLAGSRVRALDTPPTVWDVELSSYTTTSTSFGQTTSGGTYAVCGAVFTAPTTGRVEIKVTAQVSNSSTLGTSVAAETRLGAVIGSGTVVEAVADGTGLIHYGTDGSRKTISHVLSGLTPGAVYNVILLHKVSGASTGTILRRELIVAPLT
ncbi:hypothetical protein AB0M28_13400 [Streptomyces sp. NPDC051940]|uniref:hypothetical protein n=1 Tax=Streptomyces sp. NPDC051940 TaxID=3155675 RepID=UPI003441F221